MLYCPVIQDLQYNTLRFAYCIHSLSRTRHPRCPGLPLLSIKLARINTFIQQVRGRLPSLQSTLSESTSRHPSSWSERQQQGSPRRAAGRMSDKPAENNKAPDTKSYLSETLSAFSPWGSRSATPKPAADGASEEGSGIAAAPLSQRGGDHSVKPRHRISRKDYPKDCPKLVVQWYHAVDVSLALELYECNQLIINSTDSKT